MSVLSQTISIKRRYSRSINLERDLLIADSVLGYVPTPKAIESLNRILTAVTSPRSTRAWTLTGVYGTGKSSFAHFLASLCAPHKEHIYHNAIGIIDDEPQLKTLFKQRVTLLPKSGLIRAVATAQREPISHTIVRALSNGISQFAFKGRHPNATVDINKLMKQIAKEKNVDSTQTLKCLRSLARTSEILLIIDELGKNLEFAAYGHSNEDLYLLQQIAELPSGPNDPKVVFIGILHQAFTEYANNLTRAQRSEWGKIQGRFEDIPFVDSTAEMFQLTGQAIDQTKAKTLKASISQWSKKWATVLKKEKYLNPKTITYKNVAAVFPLHPISAIVLPTLCNRYAQNDRSLFTFLSSNEPHSLTSFLNETESSKKLKSLKLDRLYDYFVESAGLLSSSKVRNQRWIEIHGRISDARGLDADSLSVLKAIGLLNLVSLSGSLKATSKSVIYALSDSVDDNKEILYWKKVIKNLRKKGFVTWRKQLDELRIWEGSDFDIEKAIEENTPLDKEDLDKLLSDTHPLSPIVIHRHSYKTGTLRYFERHYISSLDDLNKVDITKSNCDGVICLSVTENTIPKEISVQFINDRPLIIIQPTIDIKMLRKACLEYAALNKIQRSCPELQSDGVARREVRYRLTHAKHILDNILLKAFGFTGQPINCWVEGKHEIVQNTREFNSRISDVCDKVYKKGLRLWNELLNKQKLTAQGATARRKLVIAMVSNEEQERLGIQGNGPEYCMYASVLSKTGIHSLINGAWRFVPPQKGSGVLQAWRAIEKFCFSAQKKPKAIDQLFQELSVPPYGIKEGAVPVLLIAFILAHKDDIALYCDGTFIPVVNSAHFEILTKNPKRFAVKHFDFSGLKSEVFRELEKVVGSTQAKTKVKMRNSTLLTIVKPLVRFISSQPAYTINTKGLSQKALKVRDALLEAREPDMLLFWNLPKACGLEPITNKTKSNTEEAKQFRLHLVKALKEIQNCYEFLLDKCHGLLYEAFSVRGDRNNLREDLRVRAKYLSDCIEPQLRRFVLAAIDDQKEDKGWLEAILMVVTDKPAESWTEMNVTEFELNLMNIARRFKNLEALISRVNSLELGDGFIARRITITKADGEEVNEVVWLDPKTQSKINEIVEDFFDKYDVGKDKEKLQSILCAISDRLFFNESETNTQFEHKIKRKTQHA